MFQYIEIIKKRLFEGWKNFESRFLESNSFNLLKERYQSLSIFKQKSIKYIVIGLFFISFVYLPFSYFISSSSYWAEFKEKQSLVLKLLRIRKKIPFSASPLSKNQMNSRIKEVINKYSGSHFTLKGKKHLPSVKDSIYELHFDVQVEHLNIKQIIRLGTDLHNLSQTQLKTIKLEENKKYLNHYDVFYKLVTFSFKEKESFNKRKKSLKKKKKRSSIRNRR